jgi:hypothetical protein
MRVKLDAGDATVAISCAGESGSRRPGITLRECWINAVGALGINADYTSGFRMVECTLVGNVNGIRLRGAMDWRIERSSVLITGGSSPRYYGLWATNGRGHMIDCDVLAWDNKEGTENTAVCVAFNDDQIAALSEFKTLYQLDNCRIAATDPAAWHNGLGVAGYGSELEDIVGCTANVVMRGGSILTDSCSPASIWQTGGTFTVEGTVYDRDQVLGTVNDLEAAIANDTGTTLPAAIAGIEAGTGATPAEIWSYTTRALTSSSSTVGPTAETEVEDIQTKCYAGSTKALSARVRAWSGDDITQAGITSIVYSIYLLDDSDPTSQTAVTGHSAVTLDKTGVIYDTLQSDEWASDYNFRHIPPISTSAAFPTAGRVYRVTYTITPTTGEKITVRFRVAAI